MYGSRRFVNYLYTTSFLEVYFVFPKKLASELALAIDSGGAYVTENTGRWP